MRDALSWLEAMLAAAGAARVKDKWQCPSHGTDGEHAVSLRVARGDNGRALLHCHAGCSYRDIMRALKLPGSALSNPLPVAPDRYARLVLPKLKFPPPKDTGGSLAERGMRFEAEHPYGNPPNAWKMRYRNPQTGEKAIIWESLNEHGERVMGLLGRPQADLPLYHEADLRAAIGAGEPVLLVESESSVDALRKAGHYATTWPGGAGDPALERLRKVLGDYPNVVIVPDNDDAGKACSGKLTEQLKNARVLMPEEKEDARDLLARVGEDGFKRLVSGQKTEAAKAVERTPAVVNPPERAWRAGVEHVTAKEPERREPQVAGTQRQSLTDALNRSVAHQYEAAVNAAKQAREQPVTVPAAEPARVQIPAQRTTSRDAVNAAHTAVTQLRTQRAADDREEQTRTAQQDVEFGKDAGMSREVAVR